ncbi:MAG: hypothetical protein ACWGN1_06855, partial [Desulfobulbales bacterium]
MNKIVIVSANGGDFIDPVAAVKSIVDASAANPYLVVIGPGEFTLTETLVMKPFVTIVGSGLEMTRLTGAISSKTPDAASAVVSAADYATVRDLTIENTGGGYDSIALYNGAGAPLIKNIAAKASGGIWSSIGVFNDIFTSTIMNGVFAIGCGGGNEHCYGVVNSWFSSPTMINVTATASGGKYTNKGVINALSASPTMINVTPTLAEKRSCSAIQIDSEVA